MASTHKPAKASGIRGFLTVVLFFTSLQAFSATFSLEGYRYNPITKRISDINHKIDLYANGSKIISDGLCTRKEPCKAEIQKKSVLTLCSKSFEAVCQTGISFDPADSPSQSFAYVLSSVYDTHYTVYRPEEMPVIDGFLKKQINDEMEMKENLNRNQNP
jgi:hypothetical protein